MRILPILAATTFLAATPCFAQTYPPPGPPPAYAPAPAPAPGGASYHENRAVNEGNAAGHEEMNADINMLHGNFSAAGRDENAAMHHTDRQVNQENRADMDAVQGQ